MRLYILLILMVCLASASTVVQNDWSGETGIAGPVSEWENSYSSSTGVSTLPGSIALACDICSPWQSVLIATDISGVYGVGTGDIDSDGNIDALLNEDSTVTWYRNPGTDLTAWEAVCVDTAFYQAWSLSCSDLDSDGDTDIVGSQFVYSPDQSLVVWWENEDGVGCQWSRHLIDDSSPMSANSVYCGDIDKDGDEDIISNAGRWYEYISDEVWQVHETGIFSCNDYDVMDFDEDGDLDIIYGYSTWAGWAENVDGYGAVWQKHDAFQRSDAFFYCVCAGDLDGDGDADIASGQYEDYAVWGKNPGTSGVWNTYYFIHSSYFMYRIKMSDMNRDSFNDLIMLGSSGVDININSGNLPLSWSNYLLPNSYALGFAVSDFNSNGIPDILTAGSGGLAWWILSEFVPEGMLESSILQAGQVKSWDWFSAEVSEVSLGIIGFQFRSSNDPSSMGVWSDTVFAVSSSLAGILEDSTDYLQYRVILQSTDPEVSPELNQIEFSFSEVPAGVEVADNYFSMLPETNPLEQSVLIKVEMVVNSQLELVLYDIEGRVIRSSDEYLTVGTHSINMGDVPSGLYFVSASNGEAKDFTRVTVLNH